MRQSNCTHPPTGCRQIKVERCRPASFESSELWVEAGSGCPAGACHRKCGPTRVGFDSRRGDRGQECRRFGQRGRFRYSDLDSEHQPERSPSTATDPDAPLSFGHLDRPAGLQVHVQPPLCCEPRRLADNRGIDPHVTSSASERACSAVRSHGRNRGNLGRD